MNHFDFSLDSVFALDIVKVKALPTHFVPAPCVAYCLDANERPPTINALFLMEKLEMPQLLYEVLDGNSVNSLLLLKHILMLFHWILLKMFMKLIG